MTLRQKLASAALTLAIAVGTAVPARAQVFLTPFAGVTFGGDSANNQFSTGIGLTAMGRVLGAEFEFGYTPDFFGEQQGTALISDSNVTSMMGSLLVGVGAGPVRPYLVAGAGLLRSRLDADDLFDDVNANDFGFNAGGGVIAMVSPRVGLRFDARYFRRLSDGDADNDVDLTIGNFHFWRASAGLTFRF